MKKRLALALLIWSILIRPAAAAGEHTAVAGEAAWWLVTLFTLQGAAIWWLTHRRYFVREGDDSKPAFFELQEYSFFLLAGAITAQLWAHGEPASYHDTIHHVLFKWPSLDLEFSLHFLINDVFMVFFFAIAAKELTEAALMKGGALRGKQAILPLFACLGGVLGPVLVFRLLATEESQSAWGVPCATDIAFAWLGARAIWGRLHPAVTFLLALAVADDFIGMAIIAIFYPTRPFSWLGLGLVLIAMAIAYAFNRLSDRSKLFEHWVPYLLLGALSWIGLVMAGLHASLALVFIVPFMPTGERDHGMFIRPVDHVNATINRFGRSIKPMVDVGLFYFGLANAGVVWWGTNTWGQDSWAVVLGLGVGKVIGICGMTWLGFLLLKQLSGSAELPKSSKTSEQLQWRDLPLVGLLGAVGFTVALFVSDAAKGSDALKLGALASFVYLGIALIVGKQLVRISPSREESSNEQSTQTA